MTEKTVDIKVEAKDVKVVKLINGDDLVTVIPTGEKQLGEKSPLVRLIRPLQIKYVPQITETGFRDYIALIKWASYTADQVITIPKDKIMTITNAHTQMVKSYFNITENEYNRELQPPEVPYKRKKLSDEDQKELNNIFKMMDVDDDEPPTMH